MAISKNFEQLEASEQHRSSKAISKTFKEQLEAALHYDEDKSDWSVSL